MGGARLAVCLCVFGAGLGASCGGGTTSSTAEGQGGEPPDEAGAPTDEGGVADAGSEASAPPPAPGTYLGSCTPSYFPDAGDAGGCAPGLTCELFRQMWGIAPNQVESCEEFVCTHPCDAGCEAPSSGCTTDLAEAGVSTTSAICAPALCH